MAYDETYRELCFIAWYKAGRPNGMKLLTVLPEDSDKRKPNVQLLAEWRTKYSWDTRGDVLDTEVARQIEKKAIEEKVEMFNRHAEMGRDLQQQGMAFFDAHPIEKDATALKAIISGVEMEKASRGLPDALMQVSKLQDEDLKDVVSKLLQHYDPNGTNVNIADLEKINATIIEGTFVDEEDNASE
jgi:hypothetical protein